MKEHVKKLAKASTISRLSASDSVSPTRFKLGILGGGQLARLLILEAHRLGIEPHVLSASKDDPAAQVTPHWHPWPTGLTPASEQKLISSFAKGLDALTFESEFIDAKALAKALNKSVSKRLPKVFPSLANIGLFQDRASQKQTLEKFKLPTAPFVLVSTEEELRLAWQKLEGPFVLKKRRNGYDGNGTHYCRKPKDLDGLSKIVKETQEGFIAEKMIHFQRECALILVRSFDGSVAELPLVESHQVESRCDWAVGPINHTRSAKLINKAKKMMASLDFVGALGIELFDTGTDLLVNELAPRVHNSGHYSQDGLSQDQFSLHLLAGLGAPLENPMVLGEAFGMVNLIGASNNPSATQEIMRSLAQKGTPLKSKLHWYGKSVSRKGRKMGHLNLTGVSQKSVLKTLLIERKRYKL